MLVCALEISPKLPRSADWLLSSLALAFLDGLLIESESDIFPLVSLTNLAAQ